MKKTVGAVLIVMVISLFAVVFSGCSSNSSPNGVSVLPAKYNTTTNSNNETENGKNEPILIHLDFDGGRSNSSTVTTGTYGEKINGLPLDLIKNGYIFSGWYTEPNCCGYQITDRSGFINDRYIINESIYGVTEGTAEGITLYAGWIERKMQVSLHIGAKTYTVEVPYGEYLQEIDIGGLSALTYSINPSGYPLYEQPITADIELYVISYKGTYSGKTTCCADNNGYNPKESGSNDNVKLHKGWSMGNIELRTQKTNLTETKYCLDYYLLQDIYNVPKGDVSGNLKDCWVNNDSFSESVYKTEIDERRVGFGAYYVEVIYQNGHSDEFSDVNFMAGSSQYDTIELCTFTAKTNDPIKEIRVTVIYELSFNNNLSYWLGCTWGANYRTEYTIKL